MLAFAWHWDGETAAHGLAERLAASLCAGIGGVAGSAAEAGTHFAWRPLRPDPARARSWRPARLPSGAVAVFHGALDNHDELVANLGIAATDPAQLYGLAVERWGEAADLRCIGEYCAILVRPEQRQLRLARSPLRAPPLHYFASPDLVAAASVPRALFAAGAPRRLNERHLADASLFNFTDHEATWYSDVAKVPLGSVVELDRAQPRKLRRYYDVLGLPKVRLGSDAEYLARAGELLDAGVKAALKGATRPGATLSGGLDSPQVALRALAALPDGSRLPTFTFHPEPEWDGISEPGCCGNERPAVEELAARHPGLEPHFTSNSGVGHDHRWSELFQLMDGAPSGLTNVYVLHGIFAQARAQGCDTLLLAEFGNQTFSENGRWGYVEYFLSGRWRQLWRALAGGPNDPRTRLRRFVALSLVGLLPDGAWLRLMRLWHPAEKRWLDLMNPLTPGFLERSGAYARAAASGYRSDRYQPRNRRHAMELTFYNADSETAEVYQAFEQLYGVRQRDPTAYRPFFEFCAGLPTDLFLRDGQTRWLARELAKGMLPEAQRLSLDNGRWDADWHLRIGRQREAYLAELDRIAGDERLSAMIDVPRLRQALAEFPERTTIDKQVVFPLEFAVPRAALAARFYRHATGRNQP